MTTIEWVGIPVIVVRHCRWDGSRNNERGGRRLLLVWPWYLTTTATTMPRCDSMAGRSTFRFDGHNFGRNDSNVIDRVFNECHCLWWWFVVVDWYGCSALPYDDDDDGGDSCYCYYEHQHECEYR